MKMIKRKDGSYYWETKTKEGGYLHFAKLIHLVIYRISKNLYIKMRETKRGLDTDYGFSIKH